jgi:hypothetical protein
MLCVPSRPLLPKYRLNLMPGGTAHIQMAKVATTVDAPIKLLWPKSPVLSAQNGFTLLGLGDVIVPGLVVALALRYDHHCATITNTIQRNGSFNRPYFRAAMLSYFIGLGMSFVVLYVFEHGQPALLYLRYVHVAFLCSIVFFFCIKLLLFLRIEQKLVWKSV